MARTSTQYRCSECDWQSAQQIGRCKNCGEFGTMNVYTPPSSSTTSNGGASSAGMKGGTTGTGVSAKAVSAADATVDSAEHEPTGLSELDRVLGGGLVPGGVVLIAGEPGVGKSTLLLDVANRVAQLANPKKVLVVSGEESVSQIRGRAVRIGAAHPGLLIAAETELGALLSHVEEHDPELLVVDSIQTIASADVDGSAGGPAQVREVAAALTRVAKSRRMKTVIVGQFTKDSNLAGPRALEHIVDTVMLFEGDAFSPLRLLRITKNRYGPADEVACFEQTETGLAEVPDPSGLFLSDRDKPTAGACVTVVMEGRRALPVEVQALVANAPPNGSPRRTVSGVDSNRLSMVLAILDRRVGAKVSSRDVYAATAAGIRVSEPSADLALLCAVASAALNRAIPRDAVFIGETSLAGDVRKVRFMAQRAAEAARLGHTRLFIPAGTRADVERAVERFSSNPLIIELKTVADAFYAVQAFPQQDDDIDDPDD